MKQQFCRNLPILCGDKVPIICNQENFYEKMPIKYKLHYQASMYYLKVQKRKPLTMADLPMVC